MWECSIASPATPPTTPPPPPDPFVPDSPVAVGLFAACTLSNCVHKIHTPNRMESACVRACGTV